MKKRILFLLIFFLSVNLAQSNGVIMAQGDITELYFDSQGSWTLELKLDFVNPDYDSVFCIYSRFDSAYFSVTPEAPGIYIYTPADFTSSFYIHPDGDSLYIISYEEYGQTAHSVTQHSFMFGDYPGSTVNTTYTGQSLVGLPDVTTTGNIVVKDNTPSLGYEKDPARGTLRGYVYDSLSNPMPYQQLHLYGITQRIVWTDENGYFEDDSCYGMNYEVFILKQYNSKLYSEVFTVEPDSVTEIEINIPTDNIVYVTGQIIGQDEQGLAGSYAIFTSEFITGPIDTFPVNPDGFFTADLVPGNYYVRFSCEGYIPKFDVSSKIFYEDENLGIRQLLEGDVIEVERGNVAGWWNAEQPYYVFGNLHIDHGDTLELEVGADINFCGAYGLDIKGMLLARGNEEDSIIMNRQESVCIAWNGLSISGPEAANSTMEYCVIQGARYFDISNASPVLEHNSLNWILDINIYDSSAPVFHSNAILSHINCYDQSEPFFHHNLISYSGSVCLSLYNNSKPTFNYNTFNTFWVALMINSSDASSSLKGNIFTNGGSLFWSWNVPINHDNIDHNLFYEMENYHSPNLPEMGVLSIVNLNGDSCDPYYNLFVDPLQVDPLGGNFHLLESSPCIDAGDPDSPFDPDSTIADIGSFYFDQLSIYVRSPHDEQDLYSIMAMPNPNDGNFRMSVVSPDNHFYETTVSLYSMQGNLVEVKDIAQLERGRNTIVFDTPREGYPAGTYLCTLEINNRIVTSCKIVITE